jgi:HAD superfamily hydrolase (TIGR01509 family)
MLIIFDCDGVLVDSEPLANQVLAEFLTELGQPHTAAECQARYVGRSIPSIMTDIEAESGIELPADFHAELWRRDREAFAGRLQAIPGVAEVLRGLLAAGRRRCVASSSAPERIRNSLTVTGLIDYFEPHLYSALQVARGKPAPDLFLHAAAAMAADPADCTVIEDSLAGVTAGVAAGMRVIGFAGGGHCGPGHAERLTGAGAAAVFTDMASLAEVL